MSKKARAVSALEEQARSFQLLRPRLLRLAQRTLGSAWSAEDAVQEAWVRLQRTDAAAIENLEAWLTTVVSRVCIDIIRQERARREDVLPGADVDGDVGVEAHGDAVTAPEHEVVWTERLEAALSVMLETLGPLERLALLLHDVFGLPFDEIAPIVERSPTAARQLASRARGRLRDVDVDAVREGHHGALDAFLGAARRGDFARLLQLLDPEVELRADATAVALAAKGAAHGAPRLSEHVRGADAVARIFVGRASLVQIVLVGGLPGGLYMEDGVPRAAYLVRLEDGRVRSVEVVGDAGALDALGLAARR